MTEKLIDWKKRMIQEVAEQYSCPTSMVRIKTSTQYHQHSNTGFTKIGNVLYGDSNYYYLLVDVRALAYKTAKELGLDVIEP